MKKVMLCFIALAAMFGTGARAQDLSGNWQGTLKAGQDLRVIFNFYKGDKDAWSAKMYSIDQGAQPIPVSSVTQHESNIKMSVEIIGGTFEGKLSDDGKTMTGAWTQGLQPLPLILAHATPETAWIWIGVDGAPNTFTRGNCDRRQHVASIPPGKVD